MGVLDDIADNAKKETDKAIIKQKVKLAEQKQEKAQEQDDADA